jgi:hypothetical protein
MNKTNINFYALYRNIMIVWGERVKVRMKEINDFDLLQQRDYGGRPL